MSHKKIWIVILAAGAAARFGSPKALAKWQDGTLLSHALSISSQIVGHRVKVVLGCHAPLITPLCQSDQIVLNHNWRDGMGNSLAKGVEAVIACDKDAEAILVLLVDQPFVSVSHLGHLLTRYDETKLCQFTSDQDIIGPPALIASAFFGKALQLKGEMGLKSVLAKGEWEIVPSEGALSDIDTKEDLARLKRLVDKA